MRHLALLLTGLALALSPAPAQSQLAPTAFVDATLELPGELLQRLGEVLPESPQPFAPFLGESFGGDFVFDEPGQLSLSFLAAGTLRRNTLGYFTYQLEPFEILDRQLVFPDIDPEQLARGATVTLRDAAGLPRTFAAGTRLGFFLVANGALSSPQIANWSAASAQIPALDALSNATVGHGLFSDVTALNAETMGAASEMARHTALLEFAPIPGFLDGEPAWVLSFEELHRGEGSDHDFNDLAVLFEPSPRTAMADTLKTFGVLPVDTDPDGDGVLGASDAYPNDPERASVGVWPVDGPALFGLEDLYPALGDGDYNDVVVTMSAMFVRDAEGNVKDLIVTTHFLARGGSRIHRLGLHLPELLEGASGTVAVERFLSDAGNTHEIDPLSELATLISEDQSRLETLLPNSHFAIEPAPGMVFVNTQSSEAERPAASSRVLITLDQAVPAEQLSPRAFDLYWMVYDGLDWLDVHAPGFDSFDDVHGERPPQKGSQAFIDSEGFPWMLRVHGDASFPTEALALTEAYPDFLTWAASGGALASDWGSSPAQGAELMAPLKALIPPRDWTLQLPSP